MPSEPSTPFLKPHNVVLLTVDCLRWNRLSRNGYYGETTPNIDRFAAANLHLDRGGESVVDVAQVEGH